MTEAKIRREGETLSVLLLHGFLLVLLHFPSQIPDESHEFWNQNSTPTKPPNFTYHRPPPFTRLSFCAQRYGPFIQLRMGVSAFYVVSDDEIAKDV